MCSQGRIRLSRRVGALALGIVLVVGVVVAAAAEGVAPRLTGASDPMGEVPAPTIANPITDDVRRTRSFPEQPPVIPHSIDGYQLTLNANRCLECHRRQFTDVTRAPMISISHFTDRDGQMLADVAPRRYFCNACHVQQTNAQVLVSNDFRDMLTLSPVSGD